MKNLWMLHGFGGQPTDFDVLNGVVREMGFEPRPLEIYPVLMNCSIRNEFVEALINTIRLEHGEHHILGYSMGGRLGLSLLASQPSLFKTAVIVSSNPGLQSDVAKAARVKADQKWADRFRSEDWSKLWKAWSSQAVLSESSAVEKPEEDCDREALAQCFEKLSLGNQNDYRSIIAEFGSRMCWVTGEKDQKFKAIALEMKKTVGTVCFEEVSGAGHRTIWDNLKAFERVLRQFWTS